MTSSLSIDAARRDVVRMLARIAQHVVHHRRVGHRRENRAEPVLAVEPLGDELHRLVDRALARALRETSARPRAARRRWRGTAGTRTISGAAPWTSAPMLCGGFRNSSSIADALRVARLRLERLQHQQRHDHGARPVRDLVEVERKPLRQQHDLDRHHRHRAPRHHAEQRQQHAGEDVALLGAAARADRLAGARMCGASMSSPIILSAK